MKTDRFRRAKTGKLGEPGPTLPNTPLASAKVGNVPRLPGGGRLLTLIPEGKWPPVGVAGSILTEECGERAIREPDADDRPDGEASDALEVLLVLECVC